MKEQVFLVNFKLVRTIGKFVQQEEVKVEGRIVLTNLWTYLVIKSEKTS